MNNNIKGITFSLVFEASAVNRDEKIGGNILSVKKLSRYDNKTYTYFSRAALRHYLFETLFNKFRWKPSEVKVDNDVVQFDLTKDNILTSPELDAFGYMYTIGGQNSITRKAPIGITKAISLEPWEGDMQFAANPDLAKRANSNTNPFNKEEHYSFYKATFTLDVDKLGYDEWWIDSFKDDGNDKLQLILSKAKKDETEKDESLEAEDKSSDDDKKEKKGKKGKKKEKIEVEIVYTQKNNDVYKVDNLGEITIKNNNKVIFKLDDKEKEKRICQILFCLKNGLMMHSSGSCYGIMPKFIISAGLSAPVPIFHSFISYKQFDQSILDNGYIVDDCKYVENKGFIAESPKDVNCDWNTFLNNIGIKCNN